ncbi:MAG: ABC transporter permease, partial [Terracoccus sp.]
MTTTVNHSDSSARSGRSPESPDRDDAGRPWLIVAGREIVVRLTNKSFIVSTLVTLVFIAGFGGFSAWQSGRSSTTTVAVTGPAATQLVEKGSTAATQSDNKVSIKPQAVTDDAAAKAALTSGQADAWLHQSGGTWVLTAKDAPDSAVETAISGAVRTQALSTNAAAAGTTAAAIEKGTVLTTDRLDGQQDDSLFIKLASLAFSLLFFMAAILFGQQIAASVVEEKQSRLVEIIATAIPLR